MTKDEFRRQQKIQCPPLRGSRRGNRSIYGCPCCRSESLPKFKVTTRQIAKIKFREITRQEILQGTQEYHNDRSPDQA